MAEPQPLDPLLLLASQGWVEGLARGLVRDSSLAQDLAQEAWLAAARSGPDDPGALRGFLASVVRNLRAGVRRTEERRERRERAVARPEALPSPAELVERAELQQLLVESVLSLGEHERTAILLRYFEGLSAEEIAQRSGTPSGTVRARLARGLERLRTRLEARVDRRELLAGLCVLGRLAPPGAPLPPPVEAAAPAGSTLPFLGGLIAMKTWTLFAAGAALLITASAGLFLVDRDPASRGADRNGATELARAPELAAAPALAQADGVPAARRSEEARSQAGADAAPELAPAPPGTARLLARVVDEQGQGLAGVLLSFRDEHAATSRAGGWIEADLEADERPSLAMVVLQARGFATARRHVRIQTGAEVHLGDLVLVRGVTVRGRIADERGRPAYGVTVLTTGLENARKDPEELRRLGPLEEEATVRGTCGSDGSFELVDVPHGRWRVWAGGEGFAWSSAAVEAGIDGADDVELVLASLDAADRITARVLSPDRTPVPGALVYTWFTAANFGSGGIVYADQEGRIELLLEQRVAHDLTVQDTEGRWSEIYATGVEPGTRELELVFEPARWIDVTVADPAGDPVDAFKLDLESATEGNVLRMTASTAEPLDGARPGRTRLRIPTAAFRVVARAHGRAQEVQGPFDPDAPPSALTFRLAALPGIRGIVRDAGGAPVADADVGLFRTVDPRQVVEQNGFRLTTESWTEMKTRSDSAGRFVLYPPATRRTGLDSRLFVVRADAPGHARAELAPRAFDPHEGAEVELVLGSGGAIEGRARTAAGVDPTGFLVAFHRGDGDERTQRLGPDGRFRVEGLTPGPWMVSALDEELHGSRSSSSSTFYEDGAPPFEEWSCHVVEGETTYHDIDLSERAQARLVGELTLAGRTLQGWTAALELPEGGGDSVLAAVPLDADGRFELRVPRGGEHRLVLNGPEDANGRLVLSELLDLEPGENRWSLALRPGRIEAAGALDRGTRERFYRYEWKGTVPGHALVATVRIVPDADGRFVLATVPDGAATISRNDPPASGQEFAPWEVVSEFVVWPGATCAVALP